MFIDIYKLYKVMGFGRRWWFTLVILATQVAEIRRIVVLNQPRQIVY
jgi:hypothetical protein